MRSISHVSNPPYTATMKPETEKKLIEIMVADAIKHLKGDEFVVVDAGWSYYDNERTFYWKPGTSSDLGKIVYSGR